MTRCSATAWPGARFLLLLILVLRPGIALAVDERINDLRLDYSPLMGRDWREAGPLTNDFPDQGMDSSSAAGFTQTVSTHRREGLSWYGSLSDLEADRGTFLFGVSAALDRVATQADSITKSYLLDVFARFAWAFTPSCHLEQGLILGAGRSQTHLHFQGWWGDGSDWITSSSGFDYEYGVRIGTYFTLDSGLQFGLDVRYMVNDSLIHFRGSHVDNPGGLETSDFHPTTRVQGFGMMFNAGWRL